MQTIGHPATTMPRLKFLQKRRSSRCVTIQRRRSGPPCRCVGDPNVVEVLIVVGALPVKLTGERDEVGAGLVYARETCPYPFICQRRANDVTGHCIDLGSYLCAGYVNSEILAVGIPSRVDHAQGVRDKHWLATWVNAVNPVIITECYGPLVRPPPDRFQHQSGRVDAKVTNG